MKRYLCAQCVTESSAGCVRIESRFSPDEEVMTVFSPEGARYLARSLLNAADDAEQWVAPDVEPLDMGTESPPTDGEQAPPDKRNKRGAK